MITLLGKFRKKQQFGCLVARFQTLLIAMATACAYIIVIVIINNEMKKEEKDIN